MTETPYLPNEVTHPNGPLWVRMIDEDPLSATGGRWHLVRQGRGRKGDYHGFLLSCDRIIEGQQSSLRWHHGATPPADGPVCDECRLALPRTPTNMDDRVI